MKQTRRRFAISLSLTGSVIGLGPGKLPEGRAQAPLIETGVETGLRCWMDALFPEDEISPSGGGLGIHRQVLAKAKEIPEYWQLVEAGVDWMNHKAEERGKASFEELDEEARIEVVTEAESVAPKTTQGLFFYHTHRDGMAFYYGHQESWKGLGFPHVPQPNGFLDYTQPPS